MTLSDLQNMEIIQGHVTLLTYDERKNPDDYIVLFELEGDFITFPRKFENQEILHMFPRMDSYTGAPGIAIEI